MSLYGSNVEYGLHCLLFLAGPDMHAPVSAKDLAEFQGVSPSLVAKLFSQLQKAGIVASAEGIQGGYRLAKAASEVSVMDVILAVEGDKPLFQCKQIRRNCILYSGNPPDWATNGVCSIHAVMLEAQERMFETFRGHTLASLAQQVESKLPKSQSAAGREWFEARLAERRRGSRSKYAKRGKR
ncbi:Rrf2 family transcriptional regulator [Seongchinamella sediminis]|uniref:Rrf2 family transcriptional regulator n=1 Tax=Seongchinamella sediminis TaxID=2283635 RepID=A0A3L7DXM5_9GAMM|nr:Rrf2 family transcriptional regulator [Seongchinamella sediminis]RLQ21465.1 Rrf2 family transcriptional regulator [Seongchinamella sediminis]